MAGVAEWLDQIGLPQLTDIFEANGIDLDLLPEITNDDLKDIGVQRLVDRKRILKAIAQLPNDRDANDAKYAARSGSPAPSRSGAERRQLTVMFVDLAGSTALSSELDPEEMRNVITRYQDIVAGAVTRFDGHVAKYMGDGVLCYFGWPFAHEDDAERAVRAGLAVMEGLSGSTAPNSDPLAARAGIATGLVVVGDLIGEAAAQEEAVVGETPNLAARLQGVAEPNAVVISEGTRLLLGQVFEHQDLGMQSFKGIADPVPVFQVLRERAIESRFEARHGEAAIELVGREEELALLLQRWQQVCGGEGQAAYISGEAGIGKSRLLRALNDALKGEPHYRINYQGSPYHTDSALHPAIQQLTRAAEIAANDSDDVKLDKLERLIELAGRDCLDTAPLIAALLDLDTEPRYGKLDITAQQQRALTLQALIAQLVGLAKSQPVLFVFEDAHWIDPSTLELIALSLEEINQAKVMMVITARPSFEHRVTRHPIVTSLALNRLGRESCLRIVDRLAGGTALPADLLDAILTKTDGVPLFVEELTKTVIQSEHLRSDTAHSFGGRLSPLAVPSTLQDSLMARLDQDAGAKNVAQIGACIGREFDHALLAAVSQLGEADLTASLTSLVDTELVHRRGELPEASYVFKHALVRDAAYESLLKSKRTVVHARIAENLKKLYPERSSTEPEVLAYHYGEAGLTDEAVRNWVEAARRAMQRSAYSEALAQLERSRPLIASLPRDKEQLRFALDLQTLRATALLATRGYIFPDTIEAFQQARDLCRELGEPPEVYQVLRGLCSIETMKGNLQAALTLAEECLRLAEEKDDGATRSLGHRLAGQSHFMMGAFSHARAHVEKAIELYEPGRDRGSAAIYGLDLNTGAAQILCLDLCLLGFPDQASALSRDVLNYARELGFVFSLAVALEWTTAVRMYQGRFDLAHELATELLELATKFKLDEYVDIATTNQSLAIALAGRADEDSLARLRSHIASYQEAYGEFFGPHTLGLLANSLGEVGRTAEAVEVVDEALAMADRSQQRWSDAELHRLKAMLLLKENATATHVAEAELSYQRAIEISRDQGAKLLELRAALGFARLLQAQDRPAEARDLLAPTYDWFTEGFDTHGLEEAKGLLAELT